MASKQITGWPRVLTMGVLGGAIGMAAAAADEKGAIAFQHKVVTFPAPYQLPKYPGGTSLRLAMLHDVLLDRYLRHGAAWYERRTADARAVIASRPPRPATGPAFDDALLSAMDDLAVGLEHLHRSDEAIAVMKAKLALLPSIAVERPTPPGPQTAGAADAPAVQELQAVERAGALPPERHHQYTVRANLGTSMIHAALARAMAGDTAAPHQLAEGVGYIDESIALNPAAHFGREKWQSVAVRHLLACLQDPSLRTTYDLIGNAWEEFDKTAPALQKRSYRSYVRVGLPQPVGADAAIPAEERVLYRRQISRTGATPDWVEAVHPLVDSPAPFDEPALALVGMWTLGGGPNPHSALALAHVAQQIGQLEIAWDGYERAVELGDAFAPDAAAREALVRHCRAAQAAIARAEAPADPAGWEATTRRRHREELAWAHQYQGEYEAWEAGQIERGVPLEAPGFYEEFFKTHPPIASPVGHADELEVHYFKPNGVADALPAGVLGGGLAMLAGALGAKRVRKE
jgi:hypothetical protein